MASSSNILMSYDYCDFLVKPDFSQEVISDSKKIIANWINDIAKQREYQEWITIDSPWTKMHDDWIMVLKTQNGYQITVSFCDVGSWINVLSNIWLEALNRVESKVTGRKFIPLFPHELSHNVFSLNENELKPAISVKIDIDFEGHILHIDVFQSKFKNIKKFTFQDFENDLNNPDSNYFELLKNINEVAKLRFARIKGLKPDNIVIRNFWDFEVWEIMKMTWYAVNRFFVQIQTDQIIKYDKNNYYVWSFLDAQNQSNYANVTSPLRYYSNYLVWARISKILNDIPFVFSKEDLDFILNRINWYKKNKEKPILDTKKPKIKHHKNTSKPQQTKNNQPKNNSDQQEKNLILKKFCDIKNKDFILWYFPKALISKDRQILQYYDDYIFKLKILDVQEVISTLNKTLNIWNNFYIEPPFLISTKNLQDETIIKFEFEWTEIFSISTKQTCKKEFYTNQKSKAITWLKVQALKKILEYFMK